MGHCTFLGRWIVAASAALASAAMLLGAAPALATYGPDIATTVERLPASVTLSTTALPTFASYRITLTHNLEHDDLKPVYFTATTSVLDAAGAVVPGRAAEFVASSLPTGCAATTTTTINCTFNDGLLGAGATKVFSVTVKAPGAGAKLQFRSQTSWKECRVFEQTPPASIYTALGAPDPSQVNTFVPPGGGTLFTGSVGGMATTVDTWTTTVKLPSSAPATTAEVAETVSAITCAPDLLDCSTSKLKIPGTFANLLITLRRDVSTIGKHANICNARIYYSEPTVPAVGVTYPLEVPACTDTTYGALPRPGVPCIDDRKAYPRKSKHGHPVPAGFEGDWEFIIKAVDNGRYTN